MTLISVWTDPGVYIPASGVFLAFLIFFIRMVSTGASMKKDITAQRDDFNANKLYVEKQFAAIQDEFKSLHFNNKEVMAALALISTSMTKMENIHKDVERIEKSTTELYKIRDTQTEVLTKIREQLAGINSEMAQSREREKNKP